MKHPIISEKFIQLCERFEGLSTVHAPWSEIGVRQFYDNQSHGVIPEKEHPFFTVLMNGKKWHDWSVEQYCLAYCTDEWEGWFTYKNDMPPRMFNSVFRWAISAGLTTRSTAQ